MSRARRSGPRRAVALAAAASAASMWALVAVAMTPSVGLAVDDVPTDAKPPAAADTKLATATFAGGCFWCMEPPYDEMDGVVETIVGYTGGHTENPTYKTISSGTTGHAEAIQVRYDPGKVRYADLIDVFWRNIDPTTPNRQFCDVGSQYRTAVYYHDEAQRKIAERTKDEIDASKRLPSAIVTEIVPAPKFYPAEEYHQDYYEKNPVRYKYYRWSCGRDRRLKELWGKDGDE